MKRYSPLNRLLVLTLVGASQLVFAKEDRNRPASTGQPSTPNRVNVSCQVSASSAELDINNVRAMVLNGGDMWWNLTDARYEVPKKDDPRLPKQHSIFAGAVWLGGVDPTGQLFTAAQTYRQDRQNSPEAGYWPGPLDASGSVTEDVCAAWNSHAKVNRTVIDAFRANFTAGRIGSSDDVPQSIREWPGRNNPYLDRPGTDNELAPFVDVNFDNIYDPVLGDYPDVRGDQAIWWVMNDVGNLKNPLTPAIGLELAVQAFAFQTNDPLNNMTFYKQRLSNKGSRTLQQTFMGQWVDPDLGWFNDDYVGCDVSRGLGICYNGDNTDEGVNGYGQNPPAVGVDFFEGPVADANDSIDNDRDSYPQGVFNPDLVDEPGEKIIMSNFVYYNNDFTAIGNPTEAIHYYNYLRSKIHDAANSDLKFGGNGYQAAGVTADNYAFMFPAGAGYLSDPLGWGFGNKYTDSSKDPLAGNAGKGDGNGRPPFPWSETRTTQAGGAQNQPADRRFLQSAGPFTLRPGAVNNITIGVVWASAGSGGPQGSLNLLLYADDLAQALFDGDFQIPDGPPAPIVTASELDKQVVLAIQPREVCTPNNGCYNTETYALEDTRLPADIPDRIYRFEGYLVYQLLNSTVTASEIGNLDRARLIARGDIINGVTQIINYEYNVDVNQIIPSIKVNADGADQGIFHTLNVTEDKFATGNSRLINNKEYTFLVIPYAYNADVSKGANGLPRVQSPYLQGRFTSKITVTPHQSLFESNGLVLNSNVYDQVAITRNFGQGAGGRQLEISQADEAAILTSPDFQKLELNYQKGFGPFSVRIYDPKLVRNAEFSVKLSSRLMVSKRGLNASRQFQVGDILESTGQFTTAETPANAARTWEIDDAVVQIPGRAIINRIVSEDTAYVFDVEMLNDDQGGTFTAQVRRRSTSSGTPLEGYNEEPRSFKTADGAITGRATEYDQNDFWRWRLKEATTWNYVTRRVSEINEELIPAYGLSIQIKTGRNPGYQATLNPQTQFIGASLKHSGTEWLTGVPAEQGTLENTILGVDWLLPPRVQGAGATTEAWDPSGIYSNILPISISGVVTFRGTWAAYVDARAINSNGAAYFIGPERRLHNLRNVDVVFTSDKSKWTRVPVLQIVAPDNPAFSLTKKHSTKPSVDKDGQPDNTVAPNGQPSTGMGWFPGYAIDLDRGERLNMMFSESSAPVADGGQGPDKGTDLIWEPNSEKRAGRNFVYVLDTKYDEGKEMERIQDENAVKPAGQARNAYRDAYNSIMWVGYPKLRDQRTMFQNNSTARVSIRVDRAFASYPELPANSTGPANTPQYSFSLNEQAVRTGQTSVLCDALLKTRVVPNPYYAFSQYEQRQLDNIVKITNLPQRADITIYTLNGTLVRRLRKDTQLTSLDWNMKNESGLPISSGVYLFHIKASDAGCETVVKWFGVMRPIDLDTF
jgi:hypothetical protein